MRASETRIIADESNEPSKVKMVRMFDRLIKEAAGKGHYTVSIPHVGEEDLSGAIKAQGLLMSLGYKVESFLERGPTLKWTFLIPW